MLQSKVERASIFVRGPLWLREAIQREADHTLRSMNDLVLDTLIERFAPDYHRTTPTTDGSTSAPSDVAPVTPVGIPSEAAHVAE